MQPDFEAVAEIANWPPNQAGKPTQAAVFGVYHLERKKVCELLWTGKFQDLQPAMYWAAKKEAQAIRKDKWIMASRVLWQHELTAEQAMAAAYKQMEPQLDHALKSFENDYDTTNVDIGEGPMRKVDPKDVEAYYAEVFSKDDPQGEPLASFFGAPPSDDVPMNWDLPGDEDEDAERKPEG